MKQIIFILTIYLLLTNSVIVQAQSKKDNYFFNSFIFGSSLTYMDIGNYEPVNEFTWNINAATSIGKYIYSGVQVLNIFVNADYFDNKKMYNIFGLFTQFTVAPRSKFRPFIEISFNKGNYYFSSTSYYPDENIKLFYIGAGGGADIPLTWLSKYLFLDLSFVFYFHKEKGWRKDLFNQYIIGLNYQFGKRVQEKWY